MMTLYMEFVCVRCNKIVSYKLMSDEMNETCYKCVKEIKDEIEQKKSQELEYFENERENQLEKHLIRQENLKILLKSIHKGIKGMAFIEFGDILLHVDNILSFEKEKKSDWHDNEYYEILILTRNDKEYRINKLTNDQCTEKWNEIKKIITTEQKIFSL